MMFWFLFLLISGHPAESSKNNLTAAYAADVSSSKQISSNLLQEQPRLLPVCANLSNPPHPYYGYVQRFPLMRNFNPGAPPNVRIGPRGFHRVMVPEHTNWFLSYSPMDSPNFSLPCLQSGNILCLLFAKIRVEWFSIECRKTKTKPITLKKHSHGWTVWKVRPRFFNFVVCNPCQSSILNHPCSFTVCYYFVGAFPSLYGIIQQ